jgi:V/A-type H+/Na+-transporting ATPase subunit B
MGFRMSPWDTKLLEYGARFENEMMDLGVNIPLEQALDRGWRILADCFNPDETGIPSALVDRFWPGDRTPKGRQEEPAEAESEPAPAEETANAF